MREAHGAMHLMAGCSNMTCCISATRLGYGDREQVGRETVTFRHCIGYRRRGSEMSRRNGQHMLDRLEFTNGPSELNSLIRISKRKIERTLHASDHLLNPDCGDIRQ